MDGLLFVGLIVLAVPIGITIWLIRRAILLKTRVDELTTQVQNLNIEVFRRKREEAQARERLPIQELSQTHPVAEQETGSTLEKLIHRAPPSEPRPVVPPEPAIIVKQAPAMPPPLPRPQSVRQENAASTATPLSAPLPAAKAKPAVNWEQFMGVKGFAWMGGLALFLGVAFFIKYSFDNNLIPPELRMAISFITGLGLLIGGVVMSRRNMAALSQTLCATGVVVLYAVTFACRALYHFSFFGPLPTFLLMALITVTAFLLAARLDALVVAILGMLGGFLTPMLLSTGQDNPVGLFAYIAILNVGLITLALNKRWDFLVVLSAIGTVVMEAGWAEKFFTSEKYFEANKVLIPMAVLVGFNLVYLAANVWAKSRSKSNRWLEGSNYFLAGVAFMFVEYFMTFAPLAARPILLFGYAFVVDLIVAGVGWSNNRMTLPHSVAGVAVFALLAHWTDSYLTSGLLNASLALTFVFAVLHSAGPVWIHRRSGVARDPLQGLAQIFPPIALALVLLPIFNLPEISFLVWPFVLLVDLLAIVLAVVTLRLLPVMVVLLLTLAATGAMIFKIPTGVTVMPGSILLVGAFAVFFVAASGWLVKKMKPGLLSAEGSNPDANPLMAEAMAKLLPASSAVLPFLLLIMATLRLPMANPSPVFGLTLLLVVMALGVTKIFSLDWMPVVTLISAFAVECAWHLNRFDVNNPLMPPGPTLLAWYLLFYAVFTVYPFVFIKKFSETTSPWVASALVGPCQFLLIYRLVKAVWPNTVMGMLPAAFAIPPLISLALVLKSIPSESKSRMTQLAWIGGVGLFFITLIFPVQFDRQWITVGWALEGAALLWLFHRVPHPGLRLTGVGLLIAAFARLALNPAVLGYHARSNTPILNWYLYAYGLTALALFTGARLLAPPRDRLLNSNAPALLGSLGVILTFLLLNIEIADFFSSRGSTLTFEFSGNFARDMTYTIAWAVFALGLLIYGIARKTAGARYTAMALLGITLLKLFLHDLARLGQLYRIGAFIAVAIIAMLASFAYQKFFSTNSNPTGPQNEPKA